MKTEMSYFYILWVIVLALIFTGCIATQNPGNQPTTLPGTQAAQPTETKAPSPEPTPALPASPVPTEPDSSAFACAPETADRIINVPQQVDLLADPAQAILMLLNSGISLDQLGDELDAAEIANRPLAIMKADLDGDQRQDLAVSVYDPTSQLTPPTGRLLIYRCGQDGYSLLLEQPTQDGFGGPHLWYFADLNSDGKAELIISEALCGAHTCNENISVLAWNSPGLENRQLLSGDPLPSADIQVADLEGDGDKEILVSSAGIGSVGAGPQRGQTYILNFEPGALEWKVQDEIFDPPQYRIHALQDAERAFLSGDFTLASNLYEMVIQDDSLLEWSEPQIERQTLGAYAYYKLYMIATLQGQNDTAQEYLNALTTQAGSVPVFQAFFQLAELFSQGVSSEDAVAGCQQVQTLVNDQYQDVILESLNAFGYGNPEYDAVDICPIP